MLNIVSPVEDLDYIDLRSMLYIFDFADIIQFTLPLPVYSSREMYSPVMWAEFFLKTIPPEYIEGRINLKISGDLENQVRYFK